MGAVEDIVMVFTARDNVTPVANGIKNNVTRSTTSMSKSINSTAKSFSSAGVSFANTGTQMKSVAERLTEDFGGISASVSTLAGSMGLATIASNMWSASTQRQTNQIYLATQRGKQGAQELYDEIQRIVMEVPGDDTFMTSLLSMAAGLDTSLTVEGLQNLGDALADYYMAASAKGQLSYETEREMRNYMLSGETRALTNSVLAQEIDLLKDKNTVQERALALQTALDKTGFGGLAHYESAKNIWEETKGHFQKGAADAGDLFTPIIQVVLKTYNTIDSLFNGKLSAVLVLFSAISLAIISTIGLVGLMAKPFEKMFGVFSKGFNSIKLFISNIGEMRKAITSFGGVIPWLKNGVDELTRKWSLLGSSGRLASNFLWDSTKRNIVGIQSECASLEELSAIQLAQISSITGLTGAQLAFQAATEGSSVSTLMDSFYKDKDTLANIELMQSTLGLTYAQIAAEAQNRNMTVAELGSAYAKEYKTVATYEEIIANDQYTLSEYLSESAILSNIKTRLVKLATAIKNQIVLEAETISILINASAISLETAAENGSILAKIILTVQKYAGIIATKLESIQNEMYAYTSLKGTNADLVATAAKEGLTISHWANAGAITYENVAEEENIYLTILSSSKNIANAIARGLKTATTWLESLSTTANTATETANTVSKTGNTLSNIANAISETVRAGVRIVLIPITAGLAVVEGILTSELLIQAGALLTVLAPILLIIGAIAALIIVIEKLGESVGWWSDFGSMFEAISSGIQRLWNAFANSKPVQAVIKYFSDFFYTLQTYFGGLVQIIGVFWGAILGTESNGSFDIVGSIINAFSKLGDMIMWVWGVLDDFFNNNIVSIILSWTNPLGILLFHLDEIGKFIGQIIDAWNMFINSPLSTEMFGALGEAYDELKAPIQEIFSALAEIGDAFNEVFAVLFPESTKSGKKEFNIFVEVIRAFAQFIINYVVPAIKVLALVIRALFIPLRLILSVIKLIIGGITYLVGATQTGISIMNSALQSLWTYLEPIYNAFKFVYEVGGGVWDSLTGGNNKTSSSDGSKLLNDTTKWNSGSNLSMSTLQNRSQAGSKYTANNSQKSITMVNNYGKGSIPIDARNMTQKEAAKTIQTGLGGFSNYRKLSTS